MKKISLSILICSVLMLNLAAQVKLPAIFSDNMVLQQQSEVAIWGWGKPNSTISVVPSWGKKLKATVKENGKWMLKIQTPASGEAFSLLIKDDIRQVDIKNILIGEVWLCSGQSNMVMPMKGFPNNPVKGANEEITMARNKKIRFFDIGRASVPEPLDSLKGRWKEVNSEDLANFSAVAWYFGKMVQEKLEVPIGLITTAWGGSTIEAWMSKEALNTFPDKKIPNKGDEIKILSRTPTTLFNGMVNPLVGYGIKGCIWYQGESNKDNAAQYPELMKAMVKSWRSLWGIGDFPFYYVQIAPFKYFAEGTKGISSAYIREAQLKAEKLIPNVGMAILMDVGEEEFIHPNDKKTVGTRLAYLALLKTYGIKGIVETGPTFKSMTINGATALITFDHANNGLTSWGKELKLFELAGDDHIFYPANAKITSEGYIKLTSDKVDKPIAARYAFKDFVVGDLFNNYGLPASSFRTDDFVD